MFLTIFFSILLFVRDDNKIEHRNSDIENDEQFEVDNAINVNLICYDQYWNKFYKNTMRFLYKCLFVTLCFFMEFMCLKYIL